MCDYKIISDGSCDIPLDVAKELNIEVIPFSVQFKDNDYLKEGYELPCEKLYQEMVDNPGVFPKSSLPSTQDYYDSFLKYVNLGLKVICLCITRKFSGSFNSAMNARTMVLDENPNAEITIIDTTVNTVLQGLVVKEACKLRDNGATYEEVIKSIEDNKETGRIFFTVSELSYLQLGGRIGKLASIVGDILRITPLITLKEGEIFSSGIAISRKRALMKVKDLLAKYMKEVNATPDTYRLAVGYGYDKEEGYQFKEQLQKLYPEYNIDIEHIGATIGVHTGPHPLGVGIIKKF